MEPLKHRDQWRKLSEIRIADAEVLLASERYDAAYYLAGYAVECALKARIVRVLEGYFPPKKNLYTHKLVELLEAADRKEEFEKIAANDENFRRKWELVGRWTEESRYETYDSKSTSDMLDAVREIVQCIRRYW